jgi:subtilisin-like proprotein convertase family protein
LSIFNGTPANGNWTINVSDNVPADVGTLNQWSLHFIEGAPACAPFECPTTGGTGGTGGSGGCPDDALRAVTENGVSTSSGRGETRDEEGLRTRGNAGRT